MSLGSHYCKQLIGQEESLECTVMFTFNIYIFAVHEKVTI